MMRAGRDYGDKVIRDNEFKRAGRRRHPPGTIMVGGKVIGVVTKLEIGRPAVNHNQNKPTLSLKR